MIWCFLGTMPKLVHGVTKKVKEELAFQDNQEAIDQRIRLRDKLTPLSEVKKLKPRFNHFPDANKHALDHRPKRQPAAVVSYSDAAEFDDDNYVYVCQKPGCTRFMVPWQLENYTYAEQNRWFIARSDEDELFVRCPQHIDEWLFQHTVGNLKKFREWAKKVKELDKETNDLWSPLTPYPLDPKLIFNSDGTLRIAKFKKAKLPTWNDEGKWI